MRGYKNFEGTPHPGDLCHLVEIGYTENAINANGYPEPKDVVLCACSNKQLYEIEHAIQAIDPGCFIIMLQSNEVHGEGFRQLELGKNENKSE